MIVAHYIHRLPANYDLEAIRQRSAERGGVWDKVPDLYFKAFLVREAGHHGAIANSFSSLYLWRQDQPFCDWLMRGGYRIVTDSFGRAEIETFFVLDAFRGNGVEARFLYREDVSIPLDANLTKIFSGEADLAREWSARPGIIAVVIGLDPRKWKVVRIVLSEEEISGNEYAVAYQIAHLSRPLLDTLPQAAS